MSGCAIIVSSIAGALLLTLCVEMVAAALAWIVSKFD